MKNTNVILKRTNVTNVGLYINLYMYLVLYKCNRYPSITLSVE